MEARLRVYPQFIVSAVLFYFTTVWFTSTWQFGLGLLWNTGISIWLIGCLLAFRRKPMGNWLLLLGSITPLTTTVLLLGSIIDNQASLSGPWYTYPLVGLVILAPPAYFIWNIIHLLRTFRGPAPYTVAASLFLVTATEASSDVNLARDVNPTISLSEVDTTSLYGEGRPLGAFIVGRQNRPGNWPNLLDAPGPTYHRLTFSIPEHRS